MAKIHKDIVIIRYHRQPMLLICCSAAQDSNIRKDC